MLLSFGPLLRFYVVNLFFNMFCFVGNDEKLQEENLGIERHCNVNIAPRYPNNRKHLRRNYGVKILWGGIIRESFGRNSLRRFLMQSVSKEHSNIFL